MNRLASATAYTLAILLVGTACAQQPDTPDRQPRDDFGLTLRLTPAMIRNFLNTVADDMAEDYDLDDDQYYRVNDVLQQRIPEFLSENREALTQLATEYMEAWSAAEPPDSEFVAQWSERALPLLDKFHETVETVADDFRDVLDDEQIAKLDGYLAAMDAGTQLIDQRLRTWADGGFDAETDWHRSPMFAEAETKRRREMEQRMVEARREAIAFHLGEDWVDSESAGGKSAGGAAAAPRGTPAPPNARGAGRASKPGDKWKTYTEDFIVRYKLDAAQTQRARLYYQRAAADRDRYQRRRLPELTRIANMIEKAKTPAQRERARALKADFEQGLEHMFERLKQKLDTIPTRTQKRAALTEQKPPTGNPE